MRSDFTVYTMKPETPECSSPMIPVFIDDTGEQHEVSPDHPSVSFICHAVDLASAEHPVDQIDQNYAHGGGWSDFIGFEMSRDSAGRAVLEYPDDPPMKEHWRGAFIQTGDAAHTMFVVIMFPFSWVAVVECGPIASVMADIAREGVLPVDTYPMRVARID